MVYGKWQFWAAGYDKNSKVSRIDNLRQVEKSLGKKPKELEGAPELRKELNYLWVIFVKLKNASDGPISFSSIMSYMAIYGELTAFEVDAIFALDNCQRREAHNG